mmetsp:Transcript_29563/g.61367  ORF Transcript_29563/g.61367 Transcript_29563/m.61367 type:complete len:509 (+) Transcript_29563:51-1577(+)
MKPTTTLRSGSRQLRLPLLPMALLLVSTSLSSHAASFFVTNHHCLNHNSHFIHQCRGSSQQSLIGNPPVNRRPSRQKPSCHAAVNNRLCRESSNSDNAESASRTTTAANTTSKATISQKDILHLKQAAQIARIGYGNTFPNPAVGCLLVRHTHTNPDENDDDKDTVLGSGFHPKAGMPHAEIFALLQACGYVHDGIAAARSVMRQDEDYNSNNDGKDEPLGKNNDDEDETREMRRKVRELLDGYKSGGGASTLFANRLSKDIVSGHQHDGNVVTAYVTLEPCCHYGQTPPCALSLVTAGVNRVVVGYRDPNPRVDGGGIQLLRDAGVDVHIIGGESGEKFSSKEERQVGKMCADLVKYFVKRISPNRSAVGKSDLDESISGAKRRALRQIAGRKKTEGTMPEVEWPREKQSNENDNDMDHLNNLQIPTRFLESVDNALWDHELVLLRLNNVVKKKKGAKILGERVAEAINGHVAQVLGHTVLVYRPGLPVVLDLDDIVAGGVDVGGIE